MCTPQELLEKISSGQPHGETRPVIPAFAPEELEKEEILQPEVTADYSRLHPVKLAPFKLADVQRTPWVVKPLLLRRAVTVAVAAGGTAKTQLTLQMGVAFALGEQFAAWTPMRRAKVAFVSGEEPIDELRRRIAAVLIDRGEDFDIGMAKLDGYLHTFNTKDIALVAKDGEGKIARTQFHEELKQFVMANAIDILIIDPTIRAHHGLDENSAEMQELFNAVDTIATDANCSAMLVHHVRKSSSGSVDDQNAARGASAMVDAARVVLALANMTPEEAKDLLPEAERDNYSRYVKYKDPKQNYGVNSPMKWFEKVGVELPAKLENGESDSRMVLHPWTPPESASVLNAPWLGKFLDEIERGLGDGELYRAATRGSKETRADALLETYGVPKAQTWKAIKALLDTGTLKREIRHSAKARREVAIFVIGERGAGEAPDSELPF
jgi:hypothetical protein